MEKYKKLETLGKFFVVTPILILVLALIFIMSSSSMNGGELVPSNGVFFLNALLWFVPVGLPVVFLGMYLVFRSRFLRSKESLVK